MTPLDSGRRTSPRQPALSPLAMLSTSKVAPVAQCGVVLAMCYAAVQVLHAHDGRQPARELRPAATSVVHPAVVQGDWAQLNAGGAFFGPDVFTPWTGEQVAALNATAAAARPSYCGSNAPEVWARSVPWGHQQDLLALYDCTSEVDGVAAELRLLPVREGAVVQDAIASIGVPPFPLVVVMEAPACGAAAGAPYNWQLASLRTALASVPGQHRIVGVAPDGAAVCSVSFNATAPASGADAQLFHVVWRATEGLGSTYLGSSSSSTSSSSAISSSSSSTTLGRGPASPMLLLADAVLSGALDGPDGGDEAGVVVLLRRRARAATRFFAHARAAVALSTSSSPSARPAAATAAAIDALSGSRLRAGRRSTAPGSHDGRAAHVVFAPVPFARHDPRLVRAFASSLNASKPRLSLALLAALQSGQIRTELGAWDADPEAEDAVALSASFARALVEHAREVVAGAGDSGDAAVPPELPSLREAVAALSGLFWRPHDITVQRMFEQATAPDSLRRRRRSGARAGTTQQTPRPAPGPATLQHELLQRQREERLQEEDSAAGER
jgi:hypothetical protein